MKTVKTTMVVLMTVTIFFACESEDVSPINPAASNATAVTFDQNDNGVNQGFEDAIRRLEEKKNDGSN